MMYNPWKTINTKNNIQGDLVFQSNATKRQYNTNVNETSIINDILYESNNLVSKSGFLNKYNFILGFKWQNLQHYTDYLNCIH